MLLNCQIPATDWIVLVAVLVATIRVRSFSQPSFIYPFLSVIHSTLRVLLYSLELTSIMVLTWGLGYPFLPRSFRMYPVDVELKKYSMKVKSDPSYNCLNFIDLDDISF